jgi:hypothetical protein
MASVGAFNDMMAQFLSELQKTLPSEKGVTKAIAGFELMRSANPRKVVDTFMTSIAPYSAKIAAQDATFIEDLRNVEGLKDLNLAASWASMSPNSQGAVWSYLQTLSLLGTTISALPAETLGMIENIAQECADGIEQGGELDQKDLMGAMSKMLGSMGLGGKK